MILALLYYQGLLDTIIFLATAKIEMLLSSTVKVKIKKKKKRMPITGFNLIGI